MERILGIIDEKRNEIIDFARSLIRTHSENPPGNESAVAELIVKKLTEYGIEDVKIKKRSKDRPNVMAFVRGKKRRPVLLYNGHMDTKPLGNLGEWNFNPYSGRIVDGAIYGLGASDMKGGLAAMVMSAVSMMEANARPKGTLLLTFVADEEKGSINGAKWLMERAQIDADAGLVAEPSGLSESFEYLHIAAMGLLAFDLIVHGTQMHSGLSNLGGCVNACLKLSDVLSTMSREFKLRYRNRLYPKGPVLNLADFISGGVHYGVVPGSCVAGNDIRLITGMNPKEVECEVDGFLNKLRKRDPELEIEMQVKAYYEPVEISPEDPIVNSTMKAAEKVLKFKPRTAGFPATDDASFFIRGGIPTIPAFGPGLLTCAHKPNETVKIKDVIDATKIYSLTALDYLGNA